jgi:hypothetical protein
MQKPIEGSFPLAENQSLTCWKNLLYVKREAHKRLRRSSITSVRLKSGTKPPFISATLKGMDIFYWG